MHKTTMVNGRIVGGHSMHSEVKEFCLLRGTNCHFRTVECEGLAGEGRDIVECSKCGEQRNVKCSFDDDYN